MSQSGKEGRGDWVSPVSQRGLWDVNWGAGRLGEKLVPIPTTLAFRGLSSLRANGGHHLLCSYLNSPRQGPHSTSSQLCP